MTPFPHGRLTSPFLSNQPRDIRPGSSGRPVEGYEMRTGFNFGDYVVAYTLHASLRAPLDHLVKPAERHITDGI